MYAGSERNNYLCYGKVAVAAPVLKWDDYWIKVNGFWIEIAKKVGQPDVFCIILDAVTVKGAYEETGIQNSLFIETSNYTGSFKFYLSSTNRLDIIQLHQAIQNGQRILSDALKRRQIERMCRCEMETVAGFFGIGKEKLQLNMSMQGIDISGGKSQPQHYDFTQVITVTPKQNDNNCHTRLTLVIDEGGTKSTKEYNCAEHSQVMNAVSCYLMNINLRIQQEEKARQEAESANKE